MHDETRDFLKNKEKFIEELQKRIEAMVESQKEELNRIKSEYNYR